jgi:hypothetical protein
LRSFKKYRAYEDDLDIRIAELYADVDEGDENDPCGK